jgi:DNA-binding GntR family transcriptional regulator
MKRNNGESFPQSQLDQFLGSDEVSGSQSGVLTDADKAYQIILDKIIKAEMAPGSLIQEPVLMESLGLGRTPIREALKRLQVEHFVTVSPRRGMFVTPIAIRDINHIYEVRMELEALVIRLAVQRVTPEQLVQLEDLVNQDSLKSLTTADVIMELDRTFHFLVYQASQNQYLMADLMRYYFMSQRIWYYGLSTMKPIEIGIFEHVEIVKAIKAGSSELAEAAIRKHISNFQKNIKELLV